MSYRRLRIAVSVFFALVAVAFVVLWVRSDTVSDNLQIGLRQNRSVGIDSGVRRILIWSNTTNSDRLTVQLYSLSYTDDPCPTLENVSGFGLYYSYPLLKIQFPHWFALFTAVTVSALVGGWNSLGVRFSLRTLLIATTLVAVMLGFAVWMGR